LSPDHARLMRYYDGELDAEETAELEAELAGDPEAQGVLDGLEQLSAFVRRDAAEQPALDLTDAIMARVASEPRQDRSAAPPPARAGWRVIAPAAAAVLALAAGVALVNELSRAPQAPVPVVQQPTPRVVPSSEEAPEVPTVVAEREAVSIETVDFGAREGTIFVVQEGEGSTPVVWLMDEPTPPGTRMEPL
jgi:anti-sigma factor RsiW